MQEAVYFQPENGDRFPATIAVAPIQPEGGDIIGAVMVFRDVTQEKQLDEAKTEFVSLASHQLRTPLSTIAWYAEMLLSGDAGELAEDQRDFLQEIYDSNQRMIDLVNALLNVSRMELGTFVVDPEPVDVSAVARDTISELKPKIQSADVNLNTDFADDLPAVPADPDLLGIIFQNLLSNAIKYTPAGGDAILRIDKDDDRLLINMEDSGVGIPESQQDKIFTKLFRADNAQELEADGTGLGLYIVKSILDHAGGDIWFESTEGEGTTFFVMLPLSGMEPKEGSRELESGEF